VTDPFGLPYRPLVDDARLRGHLTTLREQVIKAGGPALTYDHLRHSAATEAIECGMSVDDTAHLTAHKNGAMNREIYVQNSSAITTKIQRARGIIE
jgi:integrase